MLVSQIIGTAKMSAVETAEQAWLTTQMNAAQEALVWASQVCMSQGLPKHRTPGEPSAHGSVLPTTSTQHAEPFSLHS